MKVSDIASLYYKATPGPWHTGHNGYKSLVLDGQSRVIAEMNGPDEAASYNGMLVASACNAVPLLCAFYDALKALVEVGEPGDDNHSHYACCGNYYGDNHTPNCPFERAEALLDTYYLT